LIHFSLLAKEDSNLNGN